MKKLKTASIFILLFMVNLAFACDACKLNQPKITQDFTHGEGPRGSTDWIIVAVVAVIVIYTLIYSVKYLVRPGEEKSSHIKYSILKD